MSLDFNLTACKKRLGDRYDEITSSPFDKTQWHPVTSSIVWNMMTIDIGKITEANVDEVFFRTKLVSLALGNCAVAFNDPATEVQVTREDIENHIGLSTNVITKTRAAWLKSRFENMTVDRLALRREKRSAHQIVKERFAELEQRKVAARNENEALTVAGDAVSR